MTGTDLVEEAALAEPIAVGPGETPRPPRRRRRRRPRARSEPPVPAPDRDGASLLALVDRLAAVLERSDLGELEVEAGGTTIILRAPSAIERPTAFAAPARARSEQPAGGRDRRRCPGPAPSRRPHPAASAAVRQGAADRHLLRRAVARRHRRTSRSATTSPSARSSG